jgi:hypothetical protein
MIVDIGGNKDADYLFLLPLAVFAFRFGLFWFLS